MEAWTFSLAANGRGREEALRARFGPSMLADNVVIEFVNVIH